MVNQKLPEFSLPLLKSRDTFSSKLFSNNEASKQRVSLLNVFASWCISCLQEHPILLKHKQDVDIYGIAWRDMPAQTMVWLGRHGDPYKAIGVDRKSEAITQLGVTGAPETFVIDSNGIIVEHIQGPLSDEVWMKKVAPLLSKKAMEAANVPE
jgi:cytochrome c biogenesis protein CcmG/thiol:disulfide interchange protein DsbE